MIIVMADSACTKFDTLIIQVKLLKSMPHFNVNPDFAIMGVTMMHVLHSPETVMMAGYAIT